MTDVPWMEWYQSLAKPSWTPVRHAESAAGGGRSPRRLGLDHHGAGVFTGRGLRLWQVTQRYRLPLIAVFGR